MKHYLTFPASADAPPALPSSCPQFSGEREAGAGIPLRAGGVLAGEVPARGAGVCLHESRQHASLSHGGVHDVRAELGAYRRWLVRRAVVTFVLALGLGFVALLVLVGGMD